MKVSSISCSRMITLRLNAPWYSKKLRSAKAFQIKADRTWSQICLMVHQETYRDLCHQLNSMLFLHKKWFSSTKIKELEKDQKNLFKPIRNLMGSSTSVRLLHFSLAEHVVFTFSVFFMRKIANIWHNENSGSSQNASNVAMNRDILLSLEML